MIILDFAPDLVIPIINSCTQSSYQKSPSKCEIVNLLKELKITKDIVIGWGRWMVGGSFGPATVKIESELIFHFNKLNFRRPLMPCLAALKAS